MHYPYQMFTNWVCSPKARARQTASSTEELCKEADPVIHTTALWTTCWQASHETVAADCYGYCLVGAEMVWINFRRDNATVEAIVRSDSVAM